MRNLALRRLTNRTPNCSSEQCDLACVDENKARSSTVGLYLLPQAGLDVVSPTNSDDKLPETQGDGTLVAAVKCQDDDGMPVWYLIGCSTRIRINGYVPFPLARLEPGALLSIGQDFWLVSLLWQPTPKPAPPELANSCCPVCGGKLSEAPVVQCPGPNCGRWTHFERPEDPKSEKFLNCYLATDPCPSCSHPATADPILVPEPHEKLLAVDGEGTW